MTFAYWLFAAVALAGAGGFLRLLFGGAPHVSDPADPAVKVGKGWLPRGEVMLLAFALALVTFGFGPLVLGSAAMTWPLAFRAILLALLIPISWTPGLGSYNSPGNGSADDEGIGFIVRPLGKLIGWAQGSVNYCNLGLAVLFGTASILIGLTAGLMSGFGPLIYCYMATGFLMGPASALIASKGWNRVVAPPWLNPTWHNGPMEIAIGALTFASLLLLL